MGAPPAAAMPTQPRVGRARTALRSATACGLRQDQKAVCTVGLGASDDVPPGYLRGKYSAVDSPASHDDVRVLDTADRYSPYR